MKLTKKDIANFTFNPFTKIGKEWMLISACDEKREDKKINTMTASWGGVGVLWNKNVFFCFVRPQRFTKEFIDAVAVSAPNRIVYVSCNPETLATDLKLLTQKGYKVKKVVPVDMFPMTEHCETVVLLRRKQADGHVRISVHTKDLKTGTH